MAVKQSALLGLLEELEATGVGERVQMRSERAYEGLFAVAMEAYLHSGVHSQGR